MTLPLPNGLGQKHKNEDRGNTGKLTRNAVFLTQERARASTIRPVALMIFWFSQG
jgi:hypothetical protein